MSCKGNVIDYLNNEIEQCCANYLFTLKQTNIRNNAHVV